MDLFNCLIERIFDICSMKFLLPIFLLISTLCFSQSSDSDSLTKKLVERHKLVNASRMSMPGYRVQIYFGNDRTKAQELRSEFLQLFPSTPAYLVYHQPNFKVRVGDFRTRLEAIGFLNKISGSYQSAFIVPDDVKLPDL